MQKREGKQMHKDLHNKDVREQVFIHVFNNEDGQAVLAYLKEMFEIRVPDTSNPNEMYLQLGRQQAIRFIENYMKGLTNGSTGNTRTSS